MWMYIICTKKKITIHYFTYYDFILLWRKWAQLPLKLLLSPVSLAHLWGLLCFQRRESCEEKWRLLPTQSGTPAIQFELSALKLRPGLGGDLSWTVARSVGFSAPLFSVVCGLTNHRDWSGTENTLSYNEGEKRKAAQTSSRDAGGLTRASPRFPRRQEQRDAWKGKKQRTGSGTGWKWRSMWQRHGRGGYRNLRSRELSFVPGPQESWSLHRGGGGRGIAGQRERQGFKRRPRRQRRSEATSDQGGLRRQQRRGGG